MGAKLGLRYSKVHFRNSGDKNSAQAHKAGLDRHEDPSTLKSEIPKVLTGFP